MIINSKPFYDQLALMTFLTCNAIVAFLNFYLRTNFNDPRRSDRWYDRRYDRWMRIRIVGLNPSLQY